MSQKAAFTSEELLEILPESILIQGTSGTFDCETFAMGLSGDTEPDTCFIAMSYESWKKGSKNSGYYANMFSDSHERFSKMVKDLKDQAYLKGVIAERPLEEATRLGLTQIIVPDGYQAMDLIAKAARDRISDKSRVIAVAGAVGKSTTVNMLDLLLADEGNYVTNKNGHNSRTGVRLYLTQLGKFREEKGERPNIATIEVAESALWESKEGICTLVKPHVSIITNVALTQYHNATKTDEDAARVIAKVANGTVAGGYVVLYRDMMYFELVKDLVVSYGAIPIVYGETSDCDVFVMESHAAPNLLGDEISDLNTTVTAQIMGETLTYQVGGLGKPIILNALAALTAAKLSGFDIGRLSKKLVAYRPIKNTGEIYKHDGITIFQNTKNSEILSINEDLKTFASLPLKKSARKIVLLSRIVNLSEYKSDVLLGIRDSLVNLGFAKVFFHEPTDEFKDLLPHIPPALLGAREQTARAIAEHVVRYLRKGDALFVMGPARASDFGEILPLLQKGITYKNQNGWVDMPLSFYQEAQGKLGTAVFSVNEDALVYHKGEYDHQHKGGLSIPVLLHLVMKSVHQAELAWTDEVMIREMDAKENAQKPALGLQVGERVSLLTLFQAVAVSCAPDAAMALAGHVFNRVGKGIEKTVPKLQKLTQRWGIQGEVVKNITGRYCEQNPQHFTLEDTLKVAHEVLSFDMRDLLSVRSVVYKKKYVASDTILGRHPSFKKVLCFGEGSNLHLIALAEHEGAFFYVVVAGAKSAKERDTQGIYALEQVIEMKRHEPEDQWVDIGEKAIVLTGDTYCGERYAKWRKGRGIEDPMQRFGDEGYLYSFEGVRPFLRADTFNVVNSECVLTPLWDKPQQSANYIDFVLGANPEKTLSCYQQVNIHGVMLANNHMMDYGQAGCVQTKQYFKKKGIYPIGAGKNTAEAETPLLLQGKERQVILFNAYGYFNENRYQNFQHYALGENIGTAFIHHDFGEMPIFQRIRTYRERYPKALIVLSPHWSTDFNTKTAEIRAIGTKAIEAGVDLILGHGPHVPIGLEQILGKPVVYSLGDFVFNTTGIDMDKKGHKPYGLVSQLSMEEETVSLRLYPIYLHRLNTFFQPRPVTKEEFEDFCAEFIGVEGFRQGSDEKGHYLEMPLR